VEALGIEECVSTLELIESGQILALGSNSEAVTGLQMLLQVLGADLHADGSMGAVTMAALQDTQTALGFDKTQSVDRDVLSSLLCAALVSKDMAQAQACFPEAENLDLLFARAQEYLGNFYTAYAAYSQLDMTQEAQNCIQEMPEDGNVYRLQNSGRRECFVNIHVSQGPVYVKFIGEGGLLVLGVYASGDEVITAKLPAGAYFVKIGSGDIWFGAQEGFGPSGTYQMLIFDGDGSITLEKGACYDLYLDNAAGQEGQGAYSQAIGFSSF